MDTTAERIPADANDAINFALSLDDRFEAVMFLKDWREGNLSDWPEYGEFLAKDDGE